MSWLYKSDAWQNKARNNCLENFLNLKIPGLAKAMDRLGTFIFKKYSIMRAGRLLF